MTAYGRKRNIAPHFPVSALERTADIDPPQTNLDLAAIRRLRSIAQASFDKYMLRVRHAITMGILLGLETK